MQIYTWPWLKWHYFLYRNAAQYGMHFLTYRVRDKGNYLCNFVTLPNTLNAACTIVTHP